MMSIRIKLAACQHCCDTQASDTIVGTLLLLLSVLKGFAITATFVW